MQKVTSACYRSAINVNGSTFKKLTQEPQRQQRHQHQQSKQSQELNLINNPILKTWLEQKQIKRLTPETMIPAGILSAIYHQYGKPLGSAQPKTIYRQLSEMVDSHDLKKYMQRHELQRMLPQSKVPFAMVMEPHVFNQYIQKSIR